MDLVVDLVIDLVWDLVVDFVLDLGRDVVRLPMVAVAEVRNLVVSRLLVEVA